MTEKKAWFQLGVEGLKKNEAINEENQLRIEQSRTPNFWLRTGEQAKITFLDTPVFFFHQHRILINSSYYSLTCIQEIDNCPVCAINKPSFVAVATVINHNEYVSKKTGKIFKNQKQVIVLKGRGKAAVLRQVGKNNDNIAFMMFDVERPNVETSCSCGEIFEKVDKQIKPAMLAKLAPTGEGAPTPEEWLKPFDYSTLFAPKSAQELARIIGGKLPTGATDDPFDIGADEPSVDKTEEPDDLKELI